MGGRILRIGSFNMLNMSYAASKKYSKIAEIIKGENLSIVAMQEVLSEGKAIHDSLLRNLGSGRWDYRWGASSSQTDMRNEGYAYIWNKNDVHLAEYKGKIYEPRILKQYRLQPGQAKLIREPYYGRFETNFGGGFEIRVINTHIRFSKDDDNSIGAVQARRNEFDVLVRCLLDRYEDRIYGNQCETGYRSQHPMYTVLTGDYNLNLNRLWTTSPYLSSAEEFMCVRDRGTEKVFVTCQDRKTTLKKMKENKAEQSMLEEPMANNYDHFTYNQMRFAQLMRTSNAPYAVEAVEKYYGGDYKKYTDEISDHVPVVMELVF